MPAKKKHQRETAKRRVERWCAEHREFMQHVDQAMLYAFKDGGSLAEADVQAMLIEHRVE
jgi:hypothetical protein